nr:hypothetical protein [Micromonospora sp. DSM 115978]
MTAMDEGLNDGAIWLSATLTISGHRAPTDRSLAPTGCQQCTSHGCAQLDWALAEAARIRARFAGADAGPEPSPDPGSR